MSPRKLKLNDLNMSIKLNDMKRGSSELNQPLNIIELNRTYDVREKSRF